MTHELLINYISLFVSLITIILIWLGLKTWKSQLKGERYYKQSIDVLRELKILIYYINDYRKPIYFSEEIYEAFIKRKDIDTPYSMSKDDFDLGKTYTEQDRWNKIIEQYRKYDDKILYLQISLNSYDIDLINNNRFIDIIMEMHRARLHKQYLDKEYQKTNSLPLEESRKKRNELDAKMDDINDKLDNLIKEENAFSIKINNYFSELNKRLRKYLK